MIEITHGKISHETHYYNLSLLFEGNNEHLDAFSTYQHGVKIIESTLEVLFMQ